MKKLNPVITWTFATVVIILITALSYTFILYFQSETESGAKEVVVRVPAGATFNDIQAQLEEAGILKHSTIFRWAAYLMREEKNVKAGEYVFKPGDSVSFILEKLSRGLVLYKRFMIPEGLMAREISSIIYKETGIDSALFENVVRDKPFIESMGFKAESLEGYLFPDTYLISWPYTAKDIAKQMTERFNSVYSDEIAKKADSLSLTKHEVVTLSSIIQAETGLKSEMPRISAVYHNRLKKGMKLEADPTVAYALGGVRRRLWYNDLKIDSPYNTYLYKGLPPGPVCSPGKAALEAAVNPEKGCDDYYFVADRKGGHIFSRTLIEHNRARKMIKSGSIKRGK